MIYGNNFDIKDNKRFESFVKNNRTYRDDKLENLKKEFKIFGKIGNDNFEDKIYKFDYNNQNKIKYKGDKQILEKGRNAFVTSRFKTDLPHFKTDLRKVRII